MCCEIDEHRGDPVQKTISIVRLIHEVVGARGVVSRIQPENAASIRVAERIGAHHDRDVVFKDKPLRIYLHPDP